MEITPRRRRALSTILAIVLAVESVSAVAAAARVSVDARVNAAPPPAAPVEAGSRTGWLSPDQEIRRTAVAGVPGVRERRAAGVALVRASSSADGTTAPGPTPSTRPSPAQVAKTVKPPKAAAPAVAYRGRNHVWIPALRINRSVHAFPCERSRPPDNYVYRWGCAGANNVYLMGHAYSVFKPLHDAYVSGRLKRGMKAYYADARGRVHVYKVKWWRVTLPTTGASWAWASLRTPSMTLQTCVGKNSRYRLMVRLVEVR